MNFAEMRKRMVETQIIRRGISDKKVIDAFLKVPRERFVPENVKPFAYEDGPLSIGEGQTVSQPYMVALMTEALNPAYGVKTLEIGTGSGYQSAILAEIGAELYSVERKSALAERAEKVLKELGYNVRIKVGDGTLGWAEFAPYERIIVTAGGPEIPASLVAQMKEGGMMVMPVGDTFSQDLLLVRKSGGKMTKENLGGCQFVKLLGAEGWQV
ncbi:MAG: protein-L-isoaspartate(D-aspartate) O-methyltransferase [Candidatus Omnitrophica bacterium]|nr:protein-L-isoaspartate(D-aspartate) O-methyltransferase [Candidatus Omnitrophota bacterium]